MQYFCKIRYLGQYFSGYQVQPEVRTVQGALNKAAREIFGVDCAVTGCSRTDRGVHAECFCLTLRLPDGRLPIPPEKLPRVMQTALPTDVSLYYAAPIDDAFHARYDVRSKTYEYRIMNTALIDPFLYGRVWFVGYPLDVIQMNRAAGYFTGTHDFSAFMAQGSHVKSTVRTIFESTVTENNGMVTFRVTGDGFLYNMVRIMTGTLFSVGTGKRAAEDIPDIIASKKRVDAGETAPPDGLYLTDVVY